MSGKPGRSGGKNKVSLDMHVLRGSFRAHRHAGRLAATSGPVWAATPAQVAALEADGRALVARLDKIYSFTPAEGELVFELAVVADRLAQIRRTRVGAETPLVLKLDKSEQLWQRQFSTLLLALRVEV